jgi:hypothetical protein
MRRVLGYTDAGDHVTYLDKSLQEYREKEANKQQKTTNGPVGPGYIDFVLVRQLAGELHMLGVGDVAADEPNLELALEVYTP